MQPYCGEAGLSQLCSELWYDYQDQVVNHVNGKGYEQFVNDFIRVRTFQDSADARSKNLHNLTLGRLHDFLTKEQEVAEFFLNKEMFDEETLGKMMKILNGTQHLNESDVRKVQYFTYGSLCLCSILPKLNFECLFTRSELYGIACIANRTHIFTQHVCVMEMNELFNECKPNKPMVLQSDNFRKLASLLDGLYKFNRICRNYGEVIETNKLILDSNTQCPPNARRLSQALYGTSDKHGKLTSIHKEINIMIMNLLGNGSFSDSKSKK